MDVKQIATNTLVHWYNDTYAKANRQYDDVIEYVYKQVLENVVETVDSDPEPLELCQWSFYSNYSRNRLDIKISYAFQVVTQINQAIAQSGRRVAMHRVDYTTSDECFINHRYTGLYGQWTTTEEAPKLTPEDVSSQDCCSSFENKTINSIEALN